MNRQQRQQQLRDDGSAEIRTKNDAKTIQNDPQTIQNSLKFARKRSENCMFSDGRIASDCFEIFGLIWNLIL